MISTHIKQLLQSGKLTFFSCLMSLIFLPVHVDYIPPFMILWLIAWILENYHSFYKIWSLKNPAVLLFMGFALYFMWYVTGLLYTKDLNNGILLVFRRLSFVIFPFVLIAPGDLIKNKIRFLLKVFTLSTLFYVLFSFGLAIFRSLYIIDGNIIFNPHPIEADYNNYFFGTDFAFSQHPTYLAMYVLFSFFIAFESFFDKKLKTSNRILWLLAAFTLLISLYFISSRAGILSALILVPLYFLFQFKKINKWWLSVLIMIVVIPLLVFSFMNNERVKYYFHEKTETSFMSKFMLDNRIPIWKSSINVIKHNFILGVGSGDASHELRKEYVHEGYSEAYYNNLNAHNQYLETFLGTGLIGFLILFSVLVFIIYKSIRKRNLSFIMFILTIMIFFLFESTLNRIAGVTFFSLFTFLLLNSDDESASVSSMN
jgi:O-antigen ligase